MAIRRDLLIIVIISFHTPVMMNMSSPGLYAPRRVEISSSMVVHCGRTSRRFQTCMKENPIHLKHSTPRINLVSFHSNNIYTYRSRNCKRGLRLRVHTPVLSSAGLDGSDNDDQNQRVQVDLQLPRRRKLVSFTCNMCGRSGFFL